MQKCAIFTYDNNMLSSDIKRSVLLLLHKKSHLSQQKNAMVRYFVGVYIINRTLQGHLRNETSLLILKNICPTRSHHAASLRSRNLEVMGTRKNGASKRETHLPRAPLVPIACYAGLCRLPCSHIMSSTSLVLKGLRHTMSSELTKFGSVLKQEKIRPTNLASITWYIAWVRRS